MNYHQAKHQPGTVLIEFYASWCPHCQRMMPIVAHVKEQLKGRAAVYQYDIDQYPDDASEAGADTIPTFIIYRGGDELWRYSSEIEGKELLRQVEAALAE